MENVFLFGRIKNTKVRVLLLVVFLLGVGNAVLGYLLSSFLTQFIRESLVGLFFAVAYFITFLLVNNYPRFIKRFGNFKTTISALVIHALALLVLVLFSNNPAIAIIATIVYLTSNPLIWIGMDIFLEFFSADRSTGRMRGLFLTVMNIGWFISPFIMGYLMGLNDNYILPMALSLLLVVTVTTIILVVVGDVTDHKASAAKRFLYFKTMKRFLKNKDLRGIYFVAFLLKFFYSWMVIYTPLYLLSLGMSWQHIGIVFTIMLIPFMLLEYPAGYIADKYLGEKEFIVSGLIIMAIACFIMFSAHSVSPVFWAILLFFSRIGASLVESMRDTYFFKKVDYQDEDLIDLFRSGWPLAYFIAPLIGTAILFFFDLEIKSLFLVLGIILVLGIYFPLSIKDTK